MVPPRKKQKLARAGVLHRNGSLRSPSSDQALPLDEHVDDQQELQGAMRDIPYEIHRLPRLKINQKRMYDGKGKYPILQYTSPYDNRLSHDYKIVTKAGDKEQHVPWTDIKSYKVMKLSGHRYHVGDVVRVSHVLERPDQSDPAEWIAQILQIRSLNKSIVYALVVWLYRPEHLPDKFKRAKYTPLEVIPSDFLQIIEGPAVSGHAELHPRPHPRAVASGKGSKACEAEHKGVERLIWRHTIDYQTETLSKSLAPCVCGKSVDFSSGEGIICDMAYCAVAHHSTCVLLHCKQRLYKEQYADKSSTAQSGSSAKPNGNAQTHVDGSNGRAATPSRSTGFMGRIVNSFTRRTPAPATESDEPDGTDEEDVPAEADQSTADKAYDAEFEDKNDGEPLMTVLTDTRTQKQSSVMVLCPSCGNSIAE